MKLSFPINNIFLEVPWLEIVGGLLRKGLDDNVRNVVQHLIQLNPYMKYQFKNILEKDETWKFQTQSNINCSHIFRTVVIVYKFTLYVQHLLERAWSDCLIESGT